MKEWFSLSAKDVDDMKTLHLSKREATKRIFIATKSLAIDNPEFTKYFDEISAINRDFFIHEIVEAIFRA